MDVFLIACCDDDVPISHGKELVVLAVVLSNDCEGCRGACGRHADTDGAVVVLIGVCVLVVHWSCCGLCRTLVFVAIVRIISTLMTSFQSGVQKKGRDSSKHRQHLVDSGRHTPTSVSVIGEYCAMPSVQLHDNEYSCT